jgi:hypothetical protein
MRERGPPRVVHYVVVLVAALGLISGCPKKIPEDALRLPESSLELRSMQSRSFEVEGESVILAASVGVLQDMEYNLDEIEKPLGVLSASKVADADSATEMVGLVVLDLICAMGGTRCQAMATASDEERIFLTLVVLPSLARSGEFTARITLQRIVYDKMHRVKSMGIIAEPKIYQEIFDKLRTSIFLEQAQQ